MEHWVVEYIGIMECWSHGSIEGIGVKEYWGNGVMEQLNNGCKNLPILQHSSSPVLHF